jgi:hypothetical protein
MESSTLKNRKKNESNPKMMFFMVSLRIMTPMMITFPLRERGEKTPEKLISLSLSILSPQVM